VLLRGEMLPTFFFSTIALKKVAQFGFTHDILATCFDSLEQKRKHGYDAHLHENWPRQSQVTLRALGLFFADAQLQRCIVFKVF
jgi:hypothetical protein